MTANMSAQGCIALTTPSAFCSRLRHTPSRRRKERNGGRKEMFLITRSCSNFSKSVANVCDIVSISVIAKKKSHSF